MKYTIYIPLDETAPARANGGWWVKIGRKKYGIVSVKHKRVSTEVVLERRLWSIKDKFNR